MPGEASPGPSPLPGPGGGEPRRPAQVRVVEDPEDVAELLRSQGARRLNRDQLARSNPDFDAVSPEAGELDAVAVADLAARDPDAAARVLAAAARAFAPQLRSAARALAARLPVGAPRRGTPDRPGTRRVVTRR